MNHNLLICESAVTYALFQRIANYCPEKEEVILNALQRTNWGNNVIAYWEDKPFLKVHQALQESVDQHPSPLSSLLSHVAIQPDNNPSIRYFEPIKWSEPVHHPDLVEPPTELQLKKYWEEIADNWITFINHASQANEIRVYHFLDWMDTWLSSVPINKANHSVQLSVHFKMMFALGAAIREGSDTVQLVLGDVSGIQSYLFDVAHIGAGKVAKRLRARSFSLGLIADSAAHRLLLDSETPMTNLILSTGGLFYAMLPSSFSLEEWEKKTNHYLYDRYHGAISLHSAVQEVHIADLSEQFPNILSSLYEKIQASKGRTFKNILTEGDRWQEETFVHHINTTKDLCDSCRKFPKVHDEFCEFCQLDEKIGRLLPKTNYLVFREGKGTISLGNGISVDLLEKVSDHHDGYFSQVWNQGKSSHISLPFQRKWIANYIPIASIEHTKPIRDKELDRLHVGEPLTFSHMAHFGVGKDLIGYLKADVDHLGMLFTVGLVSGENENKSHTIAHVVTLSRMLERFFSGGINELLNKKYRLIYTVFSGGDDLFLVGPWEDILKASAEIRNQFKQFVGSNRDVTLSAGINIVKPKLPIPHAANYAEKELDAAKDSVNRIRIQDGKTEGRNQVSIQGMTMDWRDFKFIRERAIELAKWWKDGKLSSSFIYQLATFSEMYRQYKDHGENRYLRFVSLLEYSIQRNLIDTRSLDLRDKQDKDILYWLRSLQKIDDPSLSKRKAQELDLTWGYMKLIVKLSSYYR